MGFFTHWKETDWKDMALVTCSAGISAAFSGYPTTSIILFFAAMILNGYYLWRRQDELEVYGSWEERKKFMRDSKQRQRR